MKFEHLFLFFDSPMHIWGGEVLDKLEQYNS